MLETKFGIKKAKKKVALPRRSWTINPITRVKDSAKKFLRAKTKKDLKQQDG